MKKVSLLVGLSFVLLVAACKKDRTCSCTVTRTGTSSTTGKVDQVLFGFPVTLADTTFSQPSMEIQTYDKVINKSTKSAAKNNCVSYTQPYNEKNVTSVPAASFNLVVVVTEVGEEKYECKLK
jgi:hypothetical protein